METTRISRAVPIALVAIGSTLTGFGALVAVINLGDPGNHSAGGGIAALAGMILCAQAAIIGQLIDLRQDVRINRP